MPACTAMPAEGMVVETQTEVVKQSQNAVMEFLLINHPLDCPVCDQAGECDLQDYSYTYGPDRSRFHEQKSVQPKKDIGKHVLLYSDRCIRCTRCIRFCDEVSGTSELGYFNRGVHNEVDVFPGERLDNRLSGNTVDICPVGALLDKDFLFKQRVWFLKGVDTICPGCSTGCNIRADINRERIYRLVPRENLEVNDYWMCDDGRHGWGYVHSDDRLLFPLMGGGEEPDLVLWTAALERVAEGFEKVREAHGEGAIAGIASGHLTNEENFLSGDWSRMCSGVRRLPCVRRSVRKATWFSRAGLPFMRISRPIPGAHARCWRGWGFRLWMRPRCGRASGRADQGALLPGRRPPGGGVGNGAGSPGRPGISGGSGYSGKRSDATGRCGAARCGVCRKRGDLHQLCRPGAADPARV